jgi:hypothetical protein
VKPEVVASGASTGILPVGRSASEIVASYVYDVMQFLPNPNDYAQSNPNLKTLVATNNLFDTNVADEKKALFALDSGCIITYKTRDADPIVSVPANGYEYRGIDTYPIPDSDLPSPLLQTYQPQ